MKIEDFLRPHLKNIQPYSSARDEFSGTDKIFLDANENPFESDFNRYPDPHHNELKEEISKLKNINTSKIFLGHGSDEAIDLIMRAFATPGVDRIITTSPTYGMYKVSARINDLAVFSIPLLPDFQLDIDGILEKRAKIIFLCSPNNPTGTVLRKKDVIKILDKGESIVVVDEAYIDFTKDEGFINEIDKYENLIVLQTLSKAWGLAGLRVGMAFSNPFITNILNKIKPPYNLSVTSQKQATLALKDRDSFNHNLNQIIDQRTYMMNEFSKIDLIKSFIPSQANFILARFDDADKVYNILINEGFVVRKKSELYHCISCLRISVGTPEENKRLLEKLRELSNKGI